MKKWIFAGVSLLLALALMTAACDLLPLPSAEKGVNGNTEEFAQYSADGKTLTINLEGGSPSKNMSRALTNALARMNHDYYEVVFFYDPDYDGGPTPAIQKISRTSWERGEGAALAVFRGTDPSSGINYGSVDFTQSREKDTVLNSVAAPTDIGAAILFVGKRTTKGATLLAVGTLTNTANNAGTYLGNTIVNSTTSKVTFEIAALDSSIDPDDLPGSSFFTKWIDDAVDYATASAKFTGVGSAAFITSINNSSTNNLAEGAQFAAQFYKNVKFPLFTFKSEVSTGADRFYAGKFTFMTATTTGTVNAVPGSGTNHHISEYVKGIVIATPPAVPTHEYTEIISPNVIIDGKKINGTTTNEGVKVTMVNNKTANETLSNETYFVIEVPKGKGGLLAFNFNIPVFALTSDVSETGILPVMWYVQPGIENNYIDDGKRLGGSILLGIGDPSTIEIESAFGN